VLVTKNSRIAIFGGSISTTGGGANGLFAYGTGAFASMDGGSITATGEGGHGVMASGGGSLGITNVDMTTERIHGGVVATDRGGGTIWVSGDTITNIHGNGHTVRYQADLAANQWLGGKTWKLADGGRLSPE
jgi:hypothetical protein